MVNGTNQMEQHWTSILVAIHFIETEVQMETLAQMVFGVVRLFRRGIPPERGHFCCEIPTIANPNNEILYVNICELNYGQS